MKQLCAAAIAVAVCALLCLSETVSAAVAPLLHNAASVNAKTRRSLKPVITHEQLPGGKTRTTVRGKFAAPPAAAAGVGSLTDAPIEQAHRLTFVVSNYCNTSMTLIPGSAQIMNGGFLYGGPPAVAPSFFQAELAGVEAEANPGQTQPQMNGTWSYSMAPGPSTPVPGDMQVAFFLAQGEWGMSCVWMTKWNPMLYVSEYEHIAVYVLQMGDAHFTRKPIC